MDASTLLYLSKMANSYPGMAAAAVAAAAATNNAVSAQSPNTCINQLPIYDPAVLTSMAENYLRRMYSSDPSCLTSLIANNNGNN